MQTDDLRGVATLVATDDVRSAILQAADEIDRLVKIETAAKVVLATFRKDEANGYSSRDRQYTIEMLGKYVDGQSTNSEGK